MLRRGPVSPVLSDRPDEVRECHHVAEVDGFRRRMGVSKGPPDGDVRHAVGGKRGAVVGAAGRAVLNRDSVLFRELPKRIHQRGRSHGPIVGGSDDRAVTKGSDRIVLRVHRRVGGNEGIDGVDARRTRP